MGWVAWVSGMGGMGGMGGWACDSLPAFLCCVQVEAGAADLLAAAEPRLLLSLQRPAADSRAPLTAAQLFEVQRALFLLTTLARHPQAVGSWHL